MGSDVATRDATSGRRPPRKGLRRGSLTLVGSIALGVASTAPSYSLAATLGFVVSEGAGHKAVAVVLVAFVPMYFIALAYRELNAAEPDCGTTFTWASRAFGPILGWLGGWAILVADIICMANLAQICGAYSFTVLRELGLANRLDDNLLWSTVAGVAWIVVMTYVCYRGLGVSKRVQYALLSVEILTLVVFAVAALVRVYSGAGVKGSSTPQWSWLWPGGLSMPVFAGSVLLAVFIYWGWDSAVSTNEETDAPRTTPGRAAVISTVLLLAIYGAVSTAAVAFSGVGSTGIGLGDPAHADDAFRAIGPVLFGDGPWGRIGMALLAISVLTSAAASTQTTILPTARTALSMAVFRALPSRFADIHPVHATPTWSTIGMGALSVAFYVGMTLVSERLLLALIGAIGLQIAFYYGLTGFACAWLFRRSALRSPRLALTRLVMPLLGALMLTMTFGYAVVSYAAQDYLTDTAGNVTIFGVGAVAVVGLGTLLLGLVPMALQWWRGPEFFRGETLPRDEYAG